MPFYLPQLLPLAQADQGGGAREVIDSLARTPLSQVVMFVAALTLVRLAIYPVLSKTLPHKRTGAYGLFKVLNEIVDAFVYAGVFVFLIIRPFLLQAFLIPSGSMWPTLYVNDFIVANKAIYRYSDPKVNDVVVFRPPVEAILDPKQIDEKGEVKVDFIKRCIGTPGDLIEIKKGVLYRNGQKIDEPYVHFSNTEDGVTFTPKSENEVADMTKASFKFVKWDGRVIPLNYTEYDANSPMPRGSFAGDHPYAVSPKFYIPDPDEQQKAVRLPAEKIPNGYYLMLGDNRNNSFDGRAWGMVPRESIIGRSEFIWLPLTRWHVTR